MSDDKQGASVGQASPPADEKIPNRSKTARGFDCYDSLVDDYGATAYVIESSAAQIEGDDRGPWVWIMIAGGGIKANNGAVHLAPDQARRIRDALGVWLAENVPSSAGGSVGPDWGESVAQIKALLRERGIRLHDSVVTKIADLPPAGEAADPEQADVAVLPEAVSGAEVERLRAIERAARELVRDDAGWDPWRIAAAKDALRAAPVRAADDQPGTPECGGAR